MVNLGKVAMPFLSVYAEDDHMVPPRSAQSHEKKVGTNGLHVDATARWSYRRIREQQVTGRAVEGRCTVVADALMSVPPAVRRPVTAPRHFEFSALGPSGFTRVGYVEWGPVRAERTVVCVHGLTRNSRDFDFLARRLTKLGMRVVAVDLPGRGRSEWVPQWHDYGTKLYVSVMSGLIARLNVEQVDWVGTSLGGHIGMELAALPAAPVRRLVLNDIGARVGAGALQRISNDLAESVKMRFPTVGAVETYLRHILAPFGQLSDAQWGHMALHGAVDVGNGSLRLNHDPAISKHFWLPMLIDLTLWQVWDKVACPTLILRGEDSDLLALGTVRQMKQRGIAASRGLVQSAEIVGCGHAPALMADSQIALVEDFLHGSAVASVTKALSPPGETR